ncbi:hypothetical protein D9M69_622640 [compost metagenome]
MSAKVVMNPILSSVCIPIGDWKIAAFLSSAKSLIVLNDVAPQASHSVLEATAPRKRANSSAVIGEIGFLRRSSSSFESFFMQFP